MSDMIDDIRLSPEASDLAGLAAREAVSGPAMTPRVELVTRLTDAVAEKIEELMQSPCPGARLCTAHRALIFWMLDGIVGGYDVAQRN